jgi:hypothetical protein
LKREQIPHRFAVRNDKADLAGSLKGGRLWLDLT